MCLLILKPKNISIPKKLLKKGFNLNPDGAGFAVSDGKKLTCEKGFFTFNEFHEAFQKYAKNVALIHFRTATHGPVNKESCHPWLIGENFAVAHNGVLFDFTVSPRYISDTVLFLSQVLQPFLIQNSECWCEPWAKYLVQTSIGPTNKLAILSKAGRAEIYNEERGVWLNGAWFSNPLQFNKMI